MQLNIKRSESRLKELPRKQKKKQDATDHENASQYSSDFNERGTSGDENEIQPSLISSMQELLAVFGTQMGKDDTFKHKGKHYKLNRQTSELQLGSQESNNGQVTQSVRVEWTVQNTRGLPAVTNHEATAQLDQSSFFEVRNNKSPGRRKKSNTKKANNFTQPPNNINLPTINVSIVGAHHQSPGIDQFGQRLHKQSPRASGNVNDNLYSTLQEKSNVYAVDSLKREVQLAYLFASPLVLETSEDQFFDCLPPISFKEEFEMILQTLETENLAFKYRYMMANDANLRECLNDNPIGLHFAGHGFENKEALFKTDKKAWIKYKNKGDILIFEQSNGASSFYCEKDLQELLEQTYKNQTLDFVVVASCHSECVGKIFQKAGAKHVICIDQKKLLQDDAAINFSRTFYSNIYGSNFSICESFYNAKNSVKKQIGAAEGEKFKLFTSTDHPKVCKKNDLRRRMVQGNLEYKGITPKVLKLPTKVTPFISRNGDMFDVIKRLQESNIVQVFGMPGLGKSSLLKNVSNYIGERNVYRDGVLYINFNQVKTFKEALETILQNFEDNLNPTYNMGNDITNFDMSFRKQDKSKLLRQCIKKFQRFNKSFLFVMDNIDDVGKDFTVELSCFMMQIVQESANAIKILFGSSIYFERLENYKVKKLRGLSKANSVELFLAKIPLENEDLEIFLNYDKSIMELHEYTLSKLGADNVKIQLCKHRSQGHSFKCVKDYLEQHPLFDLLAGQPLSLSLIAPLSLRHSLKEIYKKILDSPLIEVFKGRVSEDALILSLEFSLKILNDTDSKAVELFYMIGLTSQGLFEEDLEQLFEEEDTMARLESLIEISLIQQEYLDKTGKLRRFKVSPFIDKYVEQKLTAQSKRELNMFLATYYVNKLIKLKTQYSYTLDQSILKQGMQMYEKNIRQCIQKLFQVDYFDKIPEEDLKLQKKQGSFNYKNSQLYDKNLNDIGTATITMASNFNNTEQLQKRIFLSPNKKIRVVSKSKRSSPQGSQNMLINQINNNDNNQDSAGHVRRLSDFNSAALSHINMQQPIALKHHSNDIDFIMNNLHTHDLPDQDIAVPAVLITNDSQGSNSHASDSGKFQVMKGKRPFIIRPNSVLTKLEEHNKKRVSDFSSSKISQEYDDETQASLISAQLNPGSDNFGSRFNSQIYASPYDDLEIAETEKIQYNLQLERLQQLNKQFINQGRFDQLVRSLTNRLSGSQTNEFEQIHNSKLNFKKPLHEQLAKLTVYEILLFHYITVLSLIDERGAEIVNIIYPDEEFNKNNNEIKVPQNNKLLQANLRMVYIFYLLRNEKHEAVNGENLEMKALFQDINCDIGQAICLYLSAKYLQKKKRKGAYAKAEKYILKSAELFELSLETEGMEQCIKLLKKINSKSLKIAELTERMVTLGKNNVKEISRKLEERQYLDKAVCNGKESSEDKVRNMLLNVIEFSYLSKGSPVQNKQLEAINQTPQIVSKKFNLMKFQPANNSLFLQEDQNQ